MHERFHLQLYLGTAFLEFIGLFVLVVVLWWMRESIGRWRSGAGGRAPAWIAGGLALCTSLGMVGMALFTAFAAPRLIDSVEWMEAGKQEQTALIDQPAPQLRFHGVANDRHYDLEEFRGDVVLLNFWATWCRPCRKEMPDLERLQQELGGRSLTVIHLSEEPRKTLTRYLDKQQPANLHAYVEHSRLPAFALPTTYLVDREGLVRDLRVGGGRYDDFTSMVEPYL